MSKPPSSHARFLHLCLLCLATSSILTFLTHSAPTASTHAPVLPRPPVLAITTYGGLGNQLYFLSESIALARATNATLILPSIPPRNFHIANLSLSHPELSADGLLDTAFLSSIVPLALHLPPHCVRFSRLLIARRGGLKHRNSRIAQVSCFLRGGPMNVSESITNCSNTLLPPSTPVSHFLMPLSTKPSPALKHLIRDSPGQCLLIDGHTFDIAGIRAHEYLHAFLKYIRPTAHIRTIPSKMLSHHAINPANLAVLHLRFDEHECRTRPRPFRHVSDAMCLRRSLRKNDIAWHSSSSFCSAIADALPPHITHVYLALSPYTPSALAASLTSDACLRREILPSVQERLAGKVRDEREHVVVNLVERQLAIRAAVFVGDFGSTWSGTVYYKRRLEGRESLWSCRLMGDCDNLGYYERTGKIEDFREFERDVLSM